MKEFHRQLKRKAILTACALALGMSWSVAHSVPITTWSYSTTVSFSDVSWDTGDATNRVEQSELLKWGGNRDYDDPASPNGSNWFAQNSSALTLGNFAADPETLQGGLPATGTVDTLQAGGVLGPDTIGPTVSLTHWNNPISATWSSLLGATITASTMLTPEPANSQPSQAGQTLEFVFKFKETPNAGDANGLCEDGQSATTVHGWNSGDQTGGCPDIFAYQELQIVDNVFDYQGFSYFVSVLSLNADGSLNAIGIPPLASLQCTAVGWEPGCFGFVTAEGVSTTARFGFSISARPLQQVPEPASIALIGLGLAALGMMVVRRRRGTAMH